MSTIKISELATSDITLNDFFAKADTNGVATKNTIQNLGVLLQTVGNVAFKGKLLIADTPTEDGWWFAGESGTYSNAGNLVVSLTDNLVIIIRQTTFSKIDIPLSTPNLETIWDGTDNVNGATMLNIAKELILKAPLEIISNQIYNKDGIPYIDEKYINASGSILSNSSFEIIKFNLTAGQDIFLTEFVTSGAFSVAYYDSDNNQLSFEQKTGLNNTFQGVTNCAYMLVSLEKTKKNIAIASYGTTAIPYESYVSTVPNTNINSSDFFITDTGDSDIDLPINSRGVGRAIENKLDKEIGNQLFNKNATQEAVLSGSSPYDTDTFGDKSILTDAWSTGFNFGTWKIIYQVGSSLSPKIPLTQTGDTQSIITNVPSNVYQRIFYFNELGQIINIATNATTATWITNTSYVRVMFQPSFQDELMINYGTKLLAYEDYTENKPVFELQNQSYVDNVVSVLPNKLYFVKDYQSCIYFENVIKRNLNDAITIRFDRGFDYNRLCQLNFGSASTGLALVSNINIALQEGERKVRTFDVVDPATNSGKTLNYIFIGDSFTDFGQYVTETTTLLTADGVTTTEIGSTGTSTKKSEAWSGGNISNVFLDSSLGVARICDAPAISVYPETSYHVLGGTPYQGVVYIDDNANEWIVRGGANGKIRVTNEGAVSGDFATFPSSGNLTKKAGQTSLEGDAVIAYSNPVAAFLNPFLDASGNVDISNYLSVYGFSTPEVFIFQFTYNDVPENATDAEIQAVVDNFKLAADKVNAEYPSSKVVFSIEPWGSPNGNRNYNGKKVAVLRFVEKLIEEIEENASYNTFCYLAPSYAFIDLVNGYSTSTIVPCNRYPTLTERGGGDGIHPDDNGMYQIADCIYQVISNII